MFSWSRYAYALYNYQCTQPNQRTGTQLVSYIVMVNWRYLSKWYHCLHRIASMNTENYSCLANHQRFRYLLLQQDWWAMLFFFWGDVKSDTMLSRLSSPTGSTLPQWSLFWMWIKGVGMFGSKNSITFKWNTIFSPYLYNSQHYQFKIYLLSIQSHKLN